MTIMERAIQRIENASTVSALPQPTRHPIPQRQGSNPHALKLFAKLGWSLFSVDYHRMRSNRRARPLQTEGKLAHIRRHYRLMG
jgi:hypothetical protein